MNLIVVEMLLLKLSTSLICSKSEAKINCLPDMKNESLGATRCGTDSDGGDRKDFDFWNEGINCISFCKELMTNCSWGETCCQAEKMGQVTQCKVYVNADVVEEGFPKSKAVKCKAELPTTVTTSTTTTTSESSNATNIASSASTTTLSNETFTSGPQSTKSIWLDASLDVTATNGDLSVYEGDKMTLSCSTNHNWKTCSWLYDGKMCRYEYAYDKENAGNEWSYDDRSCDSNFPKHEFKKPDTYNQGNENKKYSIEFESVTKDNEGKYLCKFQRCNPEEEGFCKTDAPKDIPMFEATITVKVRENGPEPEEADQENDSESIACNLNGNKNIFLMIHVTISQIFLCFITNSIKRI